MYQDGKESIQVYRRREGDDDDDDNDDAYLALLSGSPRRVSGNMFKVLKVVSNFIPLTLIRTLSQRL